MEEAEFPVREFDGRVFFKARRDVELTEVAFFILLSKEF
jgi:hypothetical protein